ncbi:hypothetical protein CerSpe_163290 [Prunus speciosa]
MIKACSSPADARFVLDLLLQLNRGGGPKNPEPLQFKLTLRSYNQILISLSKFLHIDDVKTVYLEMLADKISPDMSTFNAIVLAYCKLGNVVEADLYVSVRRANLTAWGSGPRRSA